MDLKTEKIPNLDTSAPAIKSLGLPAYNWWEEASSGVSVDAPRGTTKFAYPITTGMSFNRTLWQLTGRQIGHEARALMNIGQVWWHSRRQQACCVYVVAVCVLSPSCCCACAQRLSHEHMHGQRPRLVVLRARCVCCLRSPRAG